MVLLQAVQLCWFPNYSCCWCFVRAGWSAALGVPCVSAVPCPLPPGNPVSQPGQKQVWWRRRSCFPAPWPGRRHRTPSSPGSPSRGTAHPVFGAMLCSLGSVGSCRGRPICHSCCPCLVPCPIVPLPSHPLTLLSLVNASLGAALRVPRGSGSGGPVRHRCRHPCLDWLARSYNPVLLIWPQHSARGGRRAGADAGTRGADITSWREGARWGEEGGKFLFL